MLKARLGLVVPCRHDVIRQGSSHTHTFLLVNGEAVTLHFDVRLQLLLDVLHLAQRLIRVGQLELEQLDALLSSATSSVSLPWGESLQASTSGLCTQLLIKLSAH